MLPLLDRSPVTLSARLSPAHATILAYEGLAQVRGNQNLGYLSLSHGALPQQAPQKQLGASHHAWDELALRLPSLIASCQQRPVLAQLPLLATTPEALPESDLARAALLLAIFAHTYAGADRRTVDSLPRAIQEPWEGVSRRLGRQKAFLSYNDLIAYNWQLVGENPGVERTVENLRLLVPTVDNDEEHRFYLTQVEILSRSTPLINATVAAQDAVLQRDLPALEVALATICEVLHKIGRTSLPKIAPHPRHRSHVHPVIWARTVAPFAVPLDSSVPGPSGTSSLLFHILDVFLERERYQSFLGKEALQLRQWFPEAHQEFLKALACVSVTQFVEEAGSSQTKELLDELREAYFGNSGFLGRHRRKVYGYLEVAFKVGRSHTIGGFSGSFSDREWEEVDKQLECSRRERTVGGCPRLSSQQPPEPETQIETLPQVREGDCLVLPSELLIHRSLATGAWTKMGETVYDLTSYLSSHPGGMIVLQQYLGADATVPFNAVGHGTDGRILATLQKFRVGTITTKSKDTRYPRWVAFGYFLTELLNSFEIEQEALQKRLVGSEGTGSVALDDETFRQEQFRLMTQRLFELDIKGTVVPVVTALAGEMAQGPMPTPELSSILTQEQMHHYLQDLHKIVIQVLQALESGVPFCPFLLTMPLQRTRDFLIS